MDRLRASLFRASACLIPIFLIAFAAPANAQLRSPDAVNELPIKPNPTASVSEVCSKLGQDDFSQLFHATCFSEINQAVVVLVSGGTNDYSGKVIADFVVDAFGKERIPTAAYLRFPDWDGVGMTFILNGDPYGPYSGENWREGLEVLKRHAPQAWFKN